ncbi:MAG: 50S ribosomal protein L3 [Negativicutes bacterium]|nr:50S ribosomal protein L3 [Negativicutes bacterium]
MKGIIGRKLGMTQIFTGDGRLVPVTVVEAGPNVVVGCRTAENDGYVAVRLGWGEIRDRKVNKPYRGQFARAGLKPVRYIREFRHDGSTEFRVGQELKVDVFSDGDLVDVTATARGKGFAGGIKRHNFRRGPMKHGSKSHREPGTIGPRMSGGGGKVFKGKKLPGRMGGHRVTVQRLSVVRVDVDRNLLLVKGAVPGPRGGLVLVRATAKPGR